MQIGKLVGVRPHPTVVRLSDAGEPWVVDAFVVTPDLERHLAGLHAALQAPAGKGAFVIGAYGSGKSHLLAWVRRQVEAGAFRSPSPRVVALSMLDWPSAARLEEVVGETVGVDPGVGDRRVRWDAWLRRSPEGAVLLIDELSEFLRSKASPAAFNEDVRFLQFLGEWAQGAPLWVVAAMQEQLEHTGQIEQGLFAKIRDRYPLRILLGAPHVRALIARSVLVKEPGYEEAVDALIAGLRQALPTAPVDFGALRECCPIHPATLDFLEEVRDRFSKARGAIGFVTAQLLGDRARNAESFLEREWGDLVTPDRIVEHFADVLAVQAEFLPLAERVLPDWQELVPRLWDQEALRRLGERLLRLLVLCWLSPRREGLTAEEATAWLLWAPSRVDPGQNQAIVERTLRKMADEGRYVVREGARYRLDPGDDAGAELDRAVARELREVALEGGALWEAVLPHLGDLPEALRLDRDAWRKRKVRWHFHEREVHVWAGSAIPTSPPSDLAMVVRLPWAPAAAPGFYTVLPEVPPPGEAHRELVALVRVAERAWKPVQEDALARRTKERRDRLAAELAAAFRNARVADRTGRELPPLRTDALGLDPHAERMLKLHFPRFEEVAPTAGPLANVTWEVWMRTGGEPPVGDAEGHRLVNTVRAAYLERMGVLRRVGLALAPAPNLDRNELVRTVTSLAGTEVEPAAIYAALGRPPWGLVPSQVTALLAWLLVQGEIDVLRDKRSWRDEASTRPSPEQYERVVLGRGLDHEALSALGVVLRALGEAVPKGWTTSAQKDAIERVSRRLGELLARAARLPLDGLPGADGVQARVEGARRAKEALGRGFDQLLHEEGPAPALAERVVELDRIVAGVEPHLGEVRRLRHLLPEGNPPDVTRPEEVGRWVVERRAAWQEAAARYRGAHRSWWAAVGEHPARGWTAPGAARVARAGTREALERIEELRARTAPCALDPSLEFEPRCACGFDGERAPVAVDLEALAGAEREVEGRLAAFFAEPDVRARTREAKKAGIVDPADVRAYLDGAARWPEVREPEVFDGHLAGLDLVATVPLDRLADRLSGRTWTRAELLRELGDLVGSLPRDRVRIEAIDDSEVGAWAVRLALRHGEPLPPALRGRDGLARGLAPEQVGEPGLRRLDELGLPEDAGDRVLRWAAEGLLPPIDHPSGHLAAVMDMGSTRGASGPADLAARAGALWAVDARMRRLFRDAWAKHLDAVAGTEVAAPATVDVLARHADATWWLVDALGAVLWVAIRGSLREILPGWAIVHETFALGPVPSNTETFLDALGDSELQHRPEKIDAVDTLLHDRAPPFPDLVALAVAELGAAARERARKLDGRRPLVVFADHGFRLARDGRKWEHGGESTLERLVPVVVLRAG